MLLISTTVVWVPSVRKVSTLLKDTVIVPRFFLLSSCSQVLFTDTIPFRGFCLVTDLAVISNGLLRDVLGTKLVFWTDQQYVSIEPSTDGDCSLVTLQDCKADSGRTQCEPDPHKGRLVQWCQGGDDIPLR